MTSLEQLTVEYDRRNRLALEAEAELPRLRRMLAEATAEAAKLRAGADILERRLRPDYADDDLTL